MRKKNRKNRKNVNLSKINKNEEKKPRVIIQTIVNIVMIAYMGTFIILFFFADFYTMGIWTLTGSIFVVIALIVCPECRSGKNLKKSSKRGTTSMPDKGINCTE